MSNVSQAGAFDAEIIETSHRIEHLVQEGAPYDQIEEEQYKLSRLIEQKRKGLYQPKDPSYYIDQFISCLTPEDRQKKSAELAEGALASINAIMEANDPYDPVHLETFISVVEFFRYFAANETAGSDVVVDDDAPADTANVEIPMFPEVFVEVNLQSKIKIDNLAAALVSRGYLTTENSRLFINRMMGRGSGVHDNHLLVAWNGDIHSAVTLLTFASNLGIIDIKPKKNPETAIIDDPDTTESRTTVAAMILHNFSFAIPRPLTKEQYERLIYRQTKETKDAVEAFHHAIETERKSLSLAENWAYKPHKSIESIIREYYRIIDFVGVAEGIRYQCRRHLSFDIVDVYHDLIMSSE